MITDREIIKASGIFYLINHEPYFGHYCELCNTNLSGNRYDLEFKYTIRDSEIFKIAVCQDCLEYIAL